LRRMRRFAEVFFLSRVRVEMIAEKQGVCVHVLRARGLTWKTSANLRNLRKWRVRKGAAPCVGVIGAGGGVVGGGGVGRENGLKWSGRSMDIWRLRAYN
jgi:hypothetical protein